MRVRLRMLVVAVVCAMLTMQNAYGWNSIGHMAVAYVAYQRLTAQQKTRVATLLALNPDYAKWVAKIPADVTPENRALYLFMIAATWPDQIKAKDSPYKSDGDAPPKSDEATNNTGYKDYFMHKYWHYIDLPLSTDGTPVSPDAPTPNAETQITAFRQVLASDAPDELKSYDLVWVMHLVGDVHQPLHCATRISATDKAGDAGGNLVTIDTPDKELHAYWDNQLGSGDWSQYMPAVKAALDLSAPDGTAAADLKEDDWVKESYALAKRSVYVNPPIGEGPGPFKIGSSPTYPINAKKVAQERVALAGARLATVLNKELK